MRKTTFLILFLVTTALLTNVSGQSNTSIVPNVPDNANPQDTNIKMRSAELERIKREQIQEEAAKFAPVSKDIVKKFPEIKEDFEGIQLAQSTIVKAYTIGKTIDYSLIEISANDINKKTKRLDANLFSPSTNIKENANNKVKKEEKAKTVKDLIVELDNAIGSFVSSKIFGNLKVIEPEVAIQTRTDLLKIQEISDKLAKEAAKQPK